MTAWPITTWTEGVDGFSLTNANAFIAASNERLNVCGLPPLPTKAAGDDGQEAAWFASMQAAVESMLGVFVVPGDYDGQADITHYADLAALRSTAGLPTPTWRAYTDHPVHEAGIDQARQAQPGDIRGEWLFEDLQKCLKALLWTDQDLTLVTRSSETPVGASTYWHSTWASAVAEAAAAYNAASPSSTYDYPRVDCQGSWAPGNLYQSWIKRVRSKFTIPACTPARAIDFYIKGVKLVPPLDGYNENVFDANLDDVIENLYSLWNTQGPTADAVESAWIGDLALPNAGPGPISQNHQWQGWCGGNNIDGGLIGTAILRWNVTGGFQYV